MTHTWQDLIQQQATSQFNDDVIDTANLMPLSQLAVLQISGDDAQSFLQNLFTNDVAALAINQAQHSGFCNPKGRLLAFFLLIRREHAYQIVLPSAMLATLKKRLTMYVLRSKVTIEDLSDSVVCLGLSSPNPSKATSLTLNTDDYQGSQTDDYFAVKLPSTTHRWLVLSPLDQVASLCQQREKQDWQLQSHHYWELLDINAGLPKVVPNTQEKFTPQQLNLDLINGVSFKKGCYPGQEVVARLHYLGKASRRLFITSAETTAQPIAGDEVHTSEGKVAGHIVAGQHQNPQILKLLVSLKLAELDAELVLADNSKLTVLSKIDD